MQCKFYYLNKRKNSTKKPADGSELATYTVKLKSSCSSLTPTIELRLPLSSNPYGWNYAYLSDFSKYYFISDYTWNTEGWWEISLKLDVLASHVVAIKAGTYFIKYAQTAFNKWIVDTRLQQISRATVLTTTAGSTQFNFSLYKTHYILTYISGSQVGNVGGNCAVVRITNASLQLMMSQLMNAGTSIWNDLIAQAGSAADCIVECHSLPFEPYTGSSAPVWLGNYDTGVSGDAINDNTREYSWNVSVPWQAQDFRKLYHNFILYLPFIGSVPISAADILETNVMIITAIIDVMTGNIKYILYSDGGEIEAPFATYIGNCARKVISSTYKNDMVGTAMSLAGAAISGAGAAISGNPAMLMGVASSLTNAAASYLTKSPSSTGSYTGCAEKFDRPTLTTIYQPTSIEPSSVSNSIGRPYFAENTLEGFSGFVQTENAHVPVACLDSERAEIESLLNNGIYLE